MKNVHLALQHWFSRHSEHLFTCQFLHTEYFQVMYDLCHSHCSSCTSVTMCHPEFSVLSQRARYLQRNYRMVDLLQRKLYICHKI